MATLLPNGRMQICGYSGTPSIWGPLVGGMIYTYAAGTSTPKATYTTAAANVENENPVVLDARGEATIFWNGAYKIVVRDADDNILYTVDNVTNDITAASVSYAGETLAFILLNGMSYSVDTIADLRDIDSQYFTSASVKGYYVAGDGGGGQYYYDSGDTTSADNGGSIIVAGDSARWKLLNYGQPYSVLQFGAVPDATTNSSTYIQKAITAAQNDGINAVTINGAFVLDNLVTTTTCSILGNSPRYYDGTNSALSLFPSVLLLGTGTMLAFEGRVNFTGVVVANKLFYDGKAYALPFANSTIANSALAAYAGVVSAAGSPIVKSCSFLGLAGGMFAEKIEDCDIDCALGYGCELGINNRADSFLTTPSGGTASRTGFAFNNTARGNGASLVNCYHANYDGGSILSGADSTASGYAYGCYFKNSSATVSPVSFVTGIDPTMQVALRDCKIVATGNTVSPVSIGALSTNAAAYLIDQCELVNATAPYAVNLGAYAGYGHITNCVSAIPLVGGDAAAVLKCVVTTPLQAHNPIAFTPVIAFGGASVGVTYTTQEGRYVVNDNVVTGSVNIVLSNNGSSTGDITITGLPYVSSNQTGAYGSATIGFFSDWNASIARGMFGRIDKNTSAIILYGNSTSAATALTETDTTNTTAIQLTFTYMIDR